MPTLNCLNRKSTLHVSGEKECKYNHQIAADMPAANLGQFLTLQILTKLGREQTIHRKKKQL
jgi:hypothetical protein